MQLTDHLSTACEEGRKALATCPDHEATVSCWCADSESLVLAYRLIAELSSVQVIAGARHANDAAPPSFILPYVLSAAYNQRGISLPACNPCPMHPSLHLLLSRCLLQASSVDTSRLHSQLHSQAEPHAAACLI